MRDKILPVLVVFFVLFSLLSSAYELANRDKIQPNRHFELVHNYYTDYNFYLSRIRQGLEGEKLVHEKYTSEPHDGSLIQIFYLALGWLGRWVGVPVDRAGDVYHVARIVFGITLMAMIAEFSRRMFTLREKRLFFWEVSAFLLAVTASTWPKLVLAHDGWRFGGYLPWWSVIDSLQRITFVPHILAGQILTVFLIMALGEPTTIRKSGNWIFLGILGFLLGLIFPPGLLVVGAASTILIAYDRQILPRLVVGLVSAPALLYLSLMVTIYPWKKLAEFDVLHPVTFNLWEYLLALGPVLPLGILGLIAANVKGEKTTRPAVAWILGLIALFVVFHFVPQQSPFRFSEVLPHVPLALLTVYLFYSLWRVWVALRPILLVSFILLILLNLGVMYSSWLWQRDFSEQKLRANWPLVAHSNYIMYPLNDLVNALTFLETHTSRTAVVLALPETGNYVPVYSGNTVYLGHANTVRAEGKEQIARRFFSGQMSQPEALAWLKQAGITYIIDGPWEQEIGRQADLGAYQFLKKIYSNSQFIIYQVP